MVSRTEALSLANEPHGVLGQANLPFVAGRAVVVNDARSPVYHNYATAANHDSVLAVAPRYLNPPARLGRAGVDAKVAWLLAVAGQGPRSHGLRESP